MSLFDKLSPIAERLAAAGTGPVPFDTVIDEVCSATEVIVNGRRTLMCGSNNYLGLSFHPAVIAAGRAGARRGRHHRLARGERDLRRPPPARTPLR
jgi:8-amino-7-oxononanoate synthase